MNFRWTEIMSRIFPEWNRIKRRLFFSFIQTFFVVFQPLLDAQFLRVEQKSQDLNQSNFYSGTTRHMIQIEKGNLSALLSVANELLRCWKSTKSGQKGFRGFLLLCNIHKRSYGIWSNLCVITLGRETVLYIYYTLRETEKISDQDQFFFFILTIHRISFSLLWVYVALAAATTNSVWMRRLYILHWRSRFHFYCNTFHSIHFRLSSFLSCLLLKCHPS